MQLPLIYLNIGGFTQIFHSKISTREYRNTKICLHDRHAILCHEKSSHLFLVKLIRARFETNEILAFISSVRRQFLSGYYLALWIIRHLPSNIYPSSLFLFVLMSTLSLFNTLNETCSSLFPSQWQHRSLLSDFALLNRPNTF